MVLSDKKILFVVSQLKVGGAAKMIKYVANLCVSHFGSVTMLSYLDDFTPDDLNPAIKRIDLGIKIHKIPTWRLKALAGHRKVLKEGKFDIVCTFLPDMSLMSRLASFGTKTIVVSAERGDPFEFSKLWRTLIGWTYRKSDYCFFQLERARDFFGKSVGRHSFVIPNPYVPAQGATPFSGTRDKTIVSAGRFADQKRFDILIRAFAKVHEKHPDYRLVLYGEGDCRAMYEELSKELGITGFVDYPGYVKNVAASIRQDGVFVLSSDYEGIPNSLIEAMTVGLPCVATDCTPGGPDFLTNSGKRGLLVPIRDIDAMAAAINQIIETPELADRLSQEGIKLIEILDINVINKAWVDAFTTMINKRDGRKES
jgi:glycosyltransferase involved in cell wall biosynthesis